MTNRKQRKRTAVLLRTGRRAEGVYALKQLAKFLNANGWRPSANELAEVSGYRSRWWWWRRLRSSQRLGLVQQYPRGCWNLTPFGWQHLSLRPERQLLRKKPRRRAHRSRAAASVLARRRLAIAVMYDHPFIVPGLDERQEMPVTEG